MQESAPCVNIFVSCTDFVVKKVKIVVVCDELELNEGVISLVQRLQRDWKEGNSTLNAHNDITIQCS